MNLIDSLYMYENSIMKPTLKLLEKEREEKKGLRKTNIDRVNLMKVHYMHICK
jgi:hypothetical protein